MTPRTIPYEQSIYKKSWRTGHNKIVNIDSMDRDETANHVIIEYNKLSQKH